MDNPEEPSSCEGGGPFQMPAILIDGPGGVVVGTEVDDDPDILNCSFVEDPQDTLVTSRRIWSATQLERTCVAGRADNGAGDGQAQGGGAVAGAGREMIGLVAHRDTGIKPEGEGPREWRDPMLDVFRRVSRGYRPPRRSISLPEVMVDGDGEEEGGEFGGSGFHECAWTVGDSLKNGNGQSEQARVGGGGGGGGGEAEEIQQNGHGKHKEMEREKKGKKEEKRRVARDGGGKGEESGLGFLRSHQRMSVADRVRRFNVLSAWLRGPRPPPVPPAPQRGPVRLRRQGARRFSRSISHEGVAGLLQEPQSQELPEHPVSPLSPHNPRESLNPSNPLNSHDPLNPSNPLNSHDPLNPSNPLNSHDPLNPSNPLNYHDPLNPSNPLNPHNPNLLNPSCPNLPNPLEPINPPELSSKPSEPQHHHPGGQRLKEPAQGPGGRPPQHPEQEAQEGKNGPPELGLHELLELQLRIQHLEPPASQTSLCLTPPSPLEGPAKNARSPCLLSLPAPLPRHTDARSRRAPAASPPMWPLSPSDPCRPLEAGQCADSVPEISAGSDHSPTLCADGSNEMGTGGGRPAPLPFPVGVAFQGACRQEALQRFPPLAHS
ncbi:hypothetical protein SKAU_G00320270 [Synaphobranchus kaupii]|uniref:Uncharacterized protein n=1 Tax=Synaphobranchus kaupii TaxID=118154 RepID=A0A9Q1ENM8_SYNKA|nr:hypothetical protein SKAU_G00320270 [Synaphobranchus kaupii]